MLTKILFDFFNNLAHYSSDFSSFSPILLKNADYSFSLDYTDDSKELPNRVLLNFKNAESSFSLDYYIDSKELPNRVLLYFKNVDKWRDNVVRLRVNLPYETINNKINFIDCEIDRKIRWSYRASIELKAEQVNNIHFKAELLIEY